MKREFILLIMFLLLSSLPVLAQDMLIDENGNVGIGTMNPSARLEVVGLANGEGVVGLISGTGTGVYGENTTTGNYGLLGNNYYGVFGYSSNSYAGYFSGDARVTGNLIVDGVLTGAGIADITGVNAGTGLTGGGTSGEVIINVEFGGSGSAASASRSDHGHEGSDITGGVIFETFIDPAIARVQEIMPFVIANDGAGSGLDADTLDGKDSTGFADSVHVQTIETRVLGLESEEAKAFVVKAARSVSDRAYIAEPELELWIKAAQKSFTLQGSMTEVDSDGDGTVVAGTDLSNNALSGAGVVTTFIQARTIMGEKSPWNELLPLWVNAGVVANQIICNAQAVSHPGRITLCYMPYEDFTIKNIFVSATDNAGNIIYQRSARGYSDSERREAMIDEAKEAVPELENWIKAVQKVGTVEENLTEVDTDGDGAVIAGTDLSNNALSAAGVVLTFVQARYNMGARSPWDGLLHLWRDGGVAANQDMCDAIAQGNHGQITICYSWSQDHFIKNLFISGTDFEPTPNVIYQKSLSAYSDSERREALIDEAKDTVPELENWIKAVQKAGTLEGNITELDTDGDGAVIAGTDLSNNALSASGVVLTFVQARYNMGARSPWDGLLHLWRDGGVAANQDMCDAIAQGNHGQITICYSWSQDNMIRTLFISGTDFDPAPNIIYQKSLVGYSERERMDATIKAAEEAVPELEKWIRAVQKGQYPSGGGLLTEVDTNGDGVVVEGPDMDNFSLSTAGVLTQFAASRLNMGQRSFWNGYNGLWLYMGPVAEQAACNAISVANPGQIVLCSYPYYEDFTVEAVFVSASNEHGILFYQKTVTGN